MIRIGIDVGGTKILVAAYDSRFRLESELKTKTRPEKGSYYFFEELHDSIKQVMAG